MSADDMRRAAASQAQRWLASAVNQGDVLLLQEVDAEGVDGDLDFDFDQLLTETDRAPQHFNPPAGA